MACYHPMPAWRTRGGQVSLGKELPDSTELRLPCGSCIGCRTAEARAWSLRCELEAQVHNHVAWSTLTYDEKNLPPTLQRRHLQTFLKRLRKATGFKGPETNGNVRFFASGEYGETNGRPHYHALLYGLGRQHADIIQAKWGLGHVETYDASPEAIAYTAGYTTKKVTDPLHAEHERVDPDTGEVYNWVPPFRQMSRNPGIGGHARKWVENWRLYAIQNGHRMPVPRYLHEAWKAQATPEQKDQLLDEKSKIALNRDAPTLYTLTAGEIIAIAKHKLQAEKRHL